MMRSGAPQVVSGGPMGRHFSDFSVFWLATEGLSRRGNNLEEPVIGPPSLIFIFIFFKVSFFYVERQFICLEPIWNLRRLCNKWFHEKFLWDWNKLISENKQLQETKTKEEERRTDLCGTKHRTFQSDTMSPYSDQINFIDPRMVRCVDELLLSRKSERGNPVRQETQVQTNILLWLFSNCRVNQNQSEWSLTER